MTIQTQQIPIGGKLTSTQPQRLSAIELSTLYDRIYDIADKLFKKYNPCNIHMRDGKICCTDKIHTKYRPKSLCCTGCRYWTTKGCTVKCLACKLYICNRFVYDYDKKGKSVRNKKYRSFVNKLDKLKNIASKSGVGVHIFFRTKKEVLYISKGKERW